eukprot:gene23290-29503_t
MKKHGLDCVHLDISHQSPAFLQEHFPNILAHCASLGIDITKEPIPVTDLTRWAEIRNFPIIPCTLCGSQENLQRKQIGQMLRDWQQLYPGRIENMAVALRNLVPSHFMDTRQFDFKGMVPNGMADAEGDKAFDAEEFPQAVGTLAGLSVMPR